MELRQPSEEFKIASEFANISLKSIEGEERKKILDEIHSKYGKSDDYYYPFWENLTNYIGVSFPFAWNWFEKLLEEKEVIFFFELNDDKKVFHLQNGSDVPEILKECYRFNFYISNKETSFLLAYNNHENLIAAGGAIEWLNDFLQKYNTSLMIYRSISI